MIRIFVGTSNIEDNWIEKILVYSLFKHTSEELDITFLRPKMFLDWNMRGWGTPFTNFRYTVPELCNFKGKAIYMDVDQLNFRDIADLYNTDLEENTYGMVWDALTDNGIKMKGTQYEKGFYCDSVMLIDCEKAQKYTLPIPEIAQFENNYKYTWFLGLGKPFKHRSEGIIKQLNPRWNSFDGRNTSFQPKDFNADNQPPFKLDEIWHLHFTAMSMQPWHPTYTPWAKANFHREDIAEVLWRYAKECKMISNPEEF
tara:strand:+ start:527 stop:1294 length:768 start_codon:yes stop_codon:yes gene_type:complete